MLILLIMILLIFMIVNLLMIISNTISKKTFKDREKTPLLNVDLTLKIQDLPFSLQFFLIAMMLLIFDVKITLLLPLISIITILNFMFLNYMYMLFISVLLLGLYHESNQGALNWEL